MVGTPTPNGLRHRLLQHFRSPSSRGKSHSTLSAPSPLSPPQLVSTSTTIPTQPLSPHTLCSSTLLEKALLRIQPDRVLVIRQYISPSARDANVALDSALAAARQQQQLCRDRRWVVSIAGHDCVLREQADKLVHWLNRFKVVGDVAANADPVHAGLPWAGVRLLLEIAVTESNQMQLLLMGCETACYVSNRLKAYTDFLDQMPATITRDNFVAAIVELFALILSFLAQAIQLYQKSTTGRAMRAFWTDDEITVFQRECASLELRLETEARNCDRTLDAQNRQIFQQFERNLKDILQELAQSHDIRDSVTRFETKFDLGKLPYASGAGFDAYGLDHDFCHPATRVDVLQQIRSWILQPKVEPIFWLNGMAGTGKSTISRTVAKWLAEYEHPTVVSLGASFFFKRGEGDRGSAVRFFPTIVRQLITKIPALAPRIASVINLDPSICSKHLGEQFEKLICRPIQQLIATDVQYPVFVLVVDALDECEKHEDVRVIVELWSRLPQITTMCLKLFLTSRPELPIELGFRSMSGAMHRDMILHDIPETILQHDILVYLQDAFLRIKNEHNNLLPSGLPLDQHWPGDQVLHKITQRAVPLFIVAATIARFVGDPYEDPVKRLAQVLDVQTTGHLSQLQCTYLPILEHLTSRVMKEEHVEQEFRVILGAIITLAEPLSTDALAVLTDVPQETITTRLRPLRSVLRISNDAGQPVRVLHLSFSEFLTSDSLQGSKLWIDSQAAHRALLRRCLDILTGPAGLRENLCALSSSSQRRFEIDSTMIQNAIPSWLHYACLYWVYHVGRGAVKLCDNGDVHSFLKKHFLHWFEALTLMRRSASLIGNLSALRLAASADKANSLTAFLDDARRFVLAYRHVVHAFPLQVYSSAVLFAPQTSLVRQACGQIPTWIRSTPNVPKAWSTMLQTLEGHSSVVKAVAFSCDGTIIASASQDRTVRLWDTGSGHELLTLEGHTRSVCSVAFSPNSKLIVSGSRDRTIRVWDVQQGLEVKSFRGHASEVTSVAFLRDGELIVSSSVAGSVRLWEVKTGHILRSITIRRATVTSIAVSHDDKLIATGASDHSVRLFDENLKQKHKFIHDEGVGSVAFSRDSTVLVAGSSLGTVRLWDVGSEKVVQELEGVADPVRAVALCPDNALVVIGSEDPSLQLWTVDSSCHDVQTLRGHTDWVNAVTVSRDGTLIASGSDDGTVRLWDLKLSQQIPLSTGHADAVTAIAFSSDGTLAISASIDATIRLWDVYTGHEMKSFAGHRHRVSIARFSHDNMLIVSGSDDRTVRLWDVHSATPERGALEGHTDQVTDAVFSIDSTVVASASCDKTIRVWSASSCQQIRVLEGHVGEIYAVAFCNHNNERLVSASSDNSVRLWDIGSGQQLRVFTGHQNWVEGAAFSNNDEHALSWSWDGTIRLWDVETGRQIQKVSGYSVEWIKLHHKGDIVITDRDAMSIQGDLEDISNAAMFANVVWLQGEWIKRGNHDILWLPHEYRSSKYAVHDSTVALGLMSGEVVFIQFDFSGW